MTVPNLMRIAKKYDFEEVHYKNTFVWDLSCKTVLEFMEFIGLHIGFHSAISPLKYNLISLNGELLIGNGG